MSAHVEEGWSGRPQFKKRKISKCVVSEGELNWKHSQTYLFPSGKQENDQIFKGKPAFFSPELLFLLDYRDIIYQPFRDHDNTFTRVL